MAYLELLKDNWVRNSLSQAFTLKNLGDEAS